jgi:hypothetical protein
MPVSAWSGAGIDVGHHPAAPRPIAVVASALTAALLAVTAAPAQAATAAQRPAASGQRRPDCAVLGLVLGRTQWSGRHTAVYERLLRD